MSRQVSCTCTCGAGSERHNHDLKYREALDHTNTADCPEAIIELIPYKPYKEQINDYMRPYIQAYNDDVNARFEAAKERYRNGEIKSRPKRRDYQLMDYDYYETHLHDTMKNPITKKVEELPMWRSIIFGLGDMDDRATGLITQEEAVSVMTKLVQKWPELFPDLKLLGATIHLDEKGFFHCHIDYKPIYDKASMPELAGLEEPADKKTRGLSVGVSQEAALKHMGYEPEQSIINKSDKAPIRFNAFRNRIYREAESLLVEHGLRLMYRASERKEPEKDSSTNQRLEAWQATQDAAIELQRQKNIMLDVVMSDDVSPEGYKQAVAAAAKIVGALDEIERQPRSRLNKNMVKVNYHLFDQLRSFVKSMVESVTHLLHKISVMDENMDYYADKAAAAEREVARLLPKEQELNALKVDYRNRDAQAQKAESELRRQKKFMRQYKVDGKSLEEIYLQQRLQQQEQNR